MYSAYYNIWKKDTEGGREELAYVLILDIGICL